MRVARRDGRPASGARVNCWGARGPQNATADGVVRFERLPPGAYTLTVCEPGFVTTSTTKELSEGENAVFVLGEPAGLTKTVRVVHADGLPVRFARVEVDPAGWVPYVRLGPGDVQTLGLWTDTDGRCVVPDLPSGETTIRARLGSRQAQATVAAGEHVELRFEDGE